MNMAVKPDTALETLHRFCKAMNDHDVDTAVSCFTDDGEYITSYVPKKHYKGIAAVREGIADYINSHPDLEFQDLSIGVSGDRGFFDWNVLFKRDGKTVKIKGCDMLEIRDGKIRKKDAYRKPE